MSTPGSRNSGERVGTNSSVSSGTNKPSRGSDSSRSISNQTMSSSSASDSTHLGAIRFGMVKVGERRLRSFSFVNPGPMELSVVELTLFPQRTAIGASADCSHFSILRAPSLPHNMRPHETCKCVVSFHPSADCSPTAILAIVPAGNHPRQHVELSGCGITHSPQPRSLLPSVSEEAPAHSRFAESPLDDHRTPRTPSSGRGPSADSLPVTTPMRLHHQPVAVGSPLMDSPPAHPSYSFSNQAGSECCNSNEEVSWLRARVSKLERAFGAYATEMARHNSEVAKVFASIARGGECAAANPAERRTPGKISINDIADFERCDEWEAFAARESDGKGSTDWPVSQSPVGYINVNEVTSVDISSGLKQEGAALGYRTPLSTKNKNVLSSFPNTQPSYAGCTGQLQTPATPMMEEIPLDALAEEGDRENGYTPPPSAMKFCPPPVTPSMHSSVGFAQSTFSAVH